MDGSTSEKMICVRKNRAFLMLDLTQTEYFPPLSVNVRLDGKSRNKEDPAASGMRDIHFKEYLMEALWHL